MYLLAPLIHKESPVRRSRTDAELKAVLVDLREKCTWESEQDSDRAWFAPLDHPEEDSIHPSHQHVWSFCPYCGRPIEFTTDGGAES
jgi:hypothetical protein